MKKFITMLLRHWSKEPLKIALTLSAVALGTGILILSFSASAILNKEITHKLSENGLIMHVANGTWQPDGTIDQVRPSQFDRNGPKAVVSDIQPVKASAIIFTLPFREVSAGGTAYRVRNIIATESSYFDIFDLNIIAGRSMAQEDIDAGFKKIWISQHTANILFGAAESSVGSYIYSPGFMQRGFGGRDRDVVPAFTVTGVYQTPKEIARKSYKIGDIIFPYTSMIPGGNNISRMQNFLSGLFVIKAEGASAEKIESSVRKVLTAEYGPDTAITVWEGSPEGSSPYMQELRQAVDIFSISVNILGIVLLIISAVGIFSIMVVESLGRRREIALERAVGASQQRIIWEFWTWSAILSLIGGLLGIIIAFLLAPPILGTLKPVFREVSGTLPFSLGIQPSAVALGIGLAFICGGFLGLLPAFSAVRGNIAETLQEV